MLWEDLNIPIKRSQKITLAAKDNKVTKEPATSDTKIAQKINCRFQEKFTKIHTVTEEGNR